MPTHAGIANSFDPVKLESAAAVHPISSHVVDESRSTIDSTDDGHPAMGSRVGVGTGLGVDVGRGVAVARGVGVNVGTGVGLDVAVGDGGSGVSVGSGTAVGETAEVVPGVSTLSGVANSDARTRSSPSVSTSVFWVSISIPFT